MYKNGHSGWLCVVIVLLLELSATSNVLAQSDAATEHEKRIKQGLDRIKSKTDPLLKKKDVFLQPEETLDTDKLQQDDDRCFEIQTIVVEGVSFFSEEKMTGITQPYENQCLGLNKINQLVAELSNLYLGQGYITSRAYVQPQNLSDGVLTVFVLEGYVQSVIAQPENLTDKQLSWAFPVENKKILNLRDLEQGLENLNRLGQNQATTALSPGDTQGSSVVAVNNQLSSAWRGSLGVDNTGVKSTGEYQLDGYLVYDNLLGLNDSLVTSFSSNIGGHELPEAKSRSYSVITSIPYGYWLFSFNANYFDYEQSVLGSTVDFLSSGSSLNTAISAEHMLYRGAQDKLNMGLSLVRKSSKNYIEDVFLETSSRTLYVWQLFAEYTHHLSAGVFNAKAKIDKSVSWFGATQELVAAEDDFQFTKYQMDLGFSTSFEVAEQPVSYNSSLQLFYSPENILASEGLSIGGRYSVRGFSGDSLFGYRGGYFRNDFTLPIKTDWSLFQTVNVFIGLDIGTTNLPEYPEKNSEWLAGSVIGLQLIHDNININASYAKALRVADILDAQEYEFDVSVRIHF